MNSIEEGFVYVASQDMPRPEHVVEVHGCDLREGAEPFTFVVKPVAKGKALYLRANDEDDKVLLLLLLLLLVVL